MRLTLSICAAIAGVNACVPGGFRQVSFAGETSTAGAEPANGRSVHVVRNTEMKDTVLEARIRYKLEEFLLSRGYRITSPDTADLYVLATFGAGERLVASTAPVFREAEVRVEQSKDGRAVKKNYLPDRMEYLRLPLLKNSVWLQVLSSDARYYRSTGNVRNLWRGEAMMIGSPATLDRNAAYLLVAALKYYGKSTPDIITVDLGSRDAAWK
ncbi:MAG TPA: hypothetical protein VJL35_15780 [Gemmatimonadaceae bacterium]|jgi:hypothetical protein|nr:hypothetical protein [Gemmatimonadaceae bacterium]